MHWVLLVDVETSGPFLVLLPRRVAVNHIKLAQPCQVVLLEVLLEIDWGMVALLDPYLLLLHELLGLGVLVVSLGGVDVLDEVLGSLAGLDELGVKPSVLLQDQVDSLGHYYNS